MVLTRRLRTFPFPPELGPQDPVALAERLLVEGPPTPSSIVGRETVEVRFMEPASLVLILTTGGASFFSDGTEHRRRRDPEHGDLLPPEDPDEAADEVEQRLAALLGLEDPEEPNEDPEEPEPEEPEPEEEAWPEEDDEILEIEVSETQRSHATALIARLCDDLALVLTDEGQVLPAPGPDGGRLTGRLRAIQDVAVYLRYHPQPNGADLLGVLMDCRGVEEVFASEEDLAALHATILKTQGDA